MLWKHRLATLVCATALALGIGANTAMFSVAEAFLLHSVPFEYPQQEREGGWTELDGRSTNEQMVSFPDASGIVDAHGSYREAASRADFALAVGSGPGETGYLGQSGDRRTDRNRATSKRGVSGFLQRVAAARDAGARICDH